MGLTESKEEEMYVKTVETARDITWLRERSERRDKRMDNCDALMTESRERICDLETEQKLLKGKLGFVVLGLSAIFTAALHAIGWIISHLGGKA